MMRHIGWTRLWRVIMCLSLISTALLITAGDWPTYLHDNQRTGTADASETDISTANAAQLGVVWSYKTGATIGSSPTVVNGTVYAGSWDGYEYALDANTGALKWRTFLGTSYSPAPNCDPPTGMGVSSAATVISNTVYVGGGDANWYALDATTGAVLWSVYTGDNSANGGHYNWSSPLIYNGYAYIGVASLCDRPLVQGQLIQVDLNTHLVVNTFNFVPNGQVGGGIWTSPSVDPATNTIFVTTGTNGKTPTSLQPLSLAMVALDASTLTVKASWQVPPSQQTTDSDWGTTPILYTDENNNPMVAGLNKGGYLYAFNRTNISAGPVWQTLIAHGGPCPTCGDASVSSAAYGAGHLYMAGGNTTIGTTPYSGSVRAFDPGTGQILWEHGTSTAVFAALAYANGIVVDAPGSTLEVLDAANGARLYSYQTTGWIYSAPSVAEGHIYTGDVNGTIYAFGFPNSGTDAGSISNVGGNSSYSFSPGSSGPATIVSCSTSTGNVVNLTVTDSSGNTVGSGTASSYCNWVSATLTAGQAYTVTTTAVAGTGAYRSSWSVNNTPVKWTTSGSLSSGGSQTFSFPTLSTQQVSLSTCGPSGANFDLYLTSAGGSTLASSTSPSNCETLTYTPSARGLFRLKEVAVSGSGPWSGNVTTDVSSSQATNTPTPTNTPVPPTATNTPTNTPVAVTNTPVPPTATNTPTNTPVAPTNTPVPTNTSLPPTNTPAPPTNTPTATATPSGPVFGTHSGTIAGVGGTDSYTFTPGASGPASIGSCLVSAGGVYSVAVYDSGNNLLGSGTNATYCNWVDTTLSAGQTYTVKTTAVSGSGLYRSAWNVNGAPVVWNLTGSGFNIGTVGGSQSVSFPILSTGYIALSTCGPAGSNFDLYLTSAGGSTLASGTTPSTCESVSYQPGARGLFRLKEVAVSGTGAWSGRITTELSSPPPTITPTPTATPASNGPSAGSYSGSIASVGGSASYTFTPGAGGPASIGSCGVSTGTALALYLYDSGNNLVGSGTNATYCNWVDTPITAGRTYTVKTVLLAGTGVYRSAWNVNGAPVVWNLTGSGFNIATQGGSQSVSFPILSNGPLSLSTCGPAGSNFDLYLTSAGGSTLASGTTPSTCETVSYTPTARGLFRLVETSISGTGLWSGSSTTR